MARSKNTGTPIAEIEHAESSRRNIPSAEQQDALVEEEQAPPPVVFARNPALDPQLVWKGKYGDAKRKGDGAALEVPSLPIYIQEVVRPVALLEDLRAGGDAAGQLSLFQTKRRAVSDEQRFDFYQHDEDWQNRLILGDSLLVMTSLAEREGLRGKVQMVYMDPPYGIKFGSNWQARVDDRDVKDGDADDVAKDPEQIRAFRDTWKDGIHSYLSYLRDRLLVARELLTDTGSVFVQIGDENVHRVRAVMDEVFGAENFVSQVTVRKTGGTTGGLLQSTADYVVWFARDSKLAKYRPQLRLRSLDGAETTAYDLIELADGSRRRLTAEERGTDVDAIGRRFQLTILTSPRVREARTGFYPVAFQGADYLPTAGEWKTHREGIARLLAAGRIDRVGTTLRYVRYLNDFPATTITNVWSDLGGASDPVYIVQTSVEVVKRCMLMATDPGDLVLDMTCGSGTTAVVAEEWGRRWITCDTSRVALSIARTRLLTSRLPYYLLADSDEGRAKEFSLTGVEGPTEKPRGELRQGFVYKRVPHITLKAIANNEEIDTIHAAWQPKLDAARAALNALLPSPREEWQIPRAPEAAWPTETHALVEAWWSLRVLRQKEIDASIARRAEVEHLVDQPYEDPKRVRVAGPFTVESLSPHRVIPMGAEAPESEQEALARRGDAPFVETVIEHLKKTGVQNGLKKQRLVFDRLDPWPGTWLQAMGETRDGLRVAVSVGPQFGTVGRALLDAAAREAAAAKVTGAVVVCGMAFEPTVARPTGAGAKGDGSFSLTATTSTAKPEVLPVRISPDLTLGMADRLKNTGAGNLFMVFGEPEMTVTKQKDGRYVVTLTGMDVYDPSTGVVRTGTAEGATDTFRGEDVACWMLDTAYDGRAFVVRQIYFPGKRDPYERLKKALRAEIHADAWQSLRSTVSRPFERPTRGTLAVKVINHYGDEVMKVWSFP